MPGLLQREGRNEKEEWVGEGLGRYFGKLGRAGQERKHEVGWLLSRPLPGLRIEKAHARSDESSGNRQPLRQPEDPSPQSSPQQRENR
jgi:predicted Zn-dependent protease